MIKRGVLAFLASLVLIVVVGNAAEKVLTVYTWEDYFSPRAVVEFERKFDCTVEFTFYECNETMFESLLNGGGYDILTPSGYDSSILYKKGKLRPLDHALLPNLTYLDKGTLSSYYDPDRLYSVPYTMTITGVAYNPDMVPADALGSWGIFGDPRLAKKVTMLNDSRETLGAALRYLGYD